MATNIAKESTLTEAKGQNPTPITESIPTSTDRPNPQPAKIRRSRGSSTGGHHHRPKRAKEPRDFALWSDEDRRQYMKVTYDLRRWKAAQYQNTYIRRKLTQWGTLKNLFWSSSEYVEELREYMKTKEKWIPVPPDESVDLPPFNI
ncbi:hypothetical protein M3Y98_00561200 [Aphelenchoides besseyi]|nr:hypothetical protein M3Y98_00561200 [Aphelenchoides besseyi]KAI6193671.1 hypothetical protein M3Y96_01043500 [Aphelenchoides besseyi]